MCKRAFSIYRKAKFHEHAFFVDKLHFVNEENDTTRFLVSERKMVFDFGSKFKLSYRRKLDGEHTNLIQKKTK